MKNLKRRHFNSRPVCLQKSLHVSSIAAAWSDITICSDIKTATLCSPCQRSHLALLLSNIAAAQRICLSASQSAAYVGDSLWSQQIWSFLSKHDRCQFRKQQMNCPTMTVLSLRKIRGNFKACNLLWLQLKIHVFWRFLLCSFFFCESTRFFMKINQS